MSEFNVGVCNDNEVIADSLPDDHNKDWSALDRLFLEIIGG